MRLLTLPRRLIDNVLRRRRTRLGRGGQRGQVIVVAVGVMALSLGAIMISVDAGWWLRDKRDAQNDADAIALAAVQELPDTVAAELRGEDWAVANGIDPSTEMAPPDCADGVLQGNFCFIDRNSDGDDDKVRVKISRPSNSFIAEALGVGTPTLNPSAAAATTYVEGACVMPWGIQGTDVIDTRFGLNDLYPPGHLYVFQNKGDFVGDSSGNFGAISIYGEGASVYKDAIGGLCEPAKNACTDEDMVFAGETLLGCTSEPGTMGAVTANALDAAHPDAPSPGSCDVSSPDGHDEANNRLDPDHPEYQSECWERAVPVAIIDAFPPSGSSADIDIHGIVTFYLAGWSKKMTCFPSDGTERCGFVWGYLLDNVPISTAKAIFTAEYIPWAPTGVALVE